MAMQHKRTIHAKDAAGNAYEIQEWAKIIDMGSMDDPTATAEGLKEYRVAGGHANRIGDTEFVIVATGTHVFVK